jgi:hypothetical protein
MSSIITKMLECRHETSIIGYTAYCVGTSITVCCFRIATICFASRSTRRNVSSARANRVCHSDGHNQYHLASCD